MCANLSKAGQLYLFPALYHSMSFRCGQDGGGEPSGDSMMGEPPHLLDVEWLPDHLVMSACGSRRQVPYSLGRE